MDEKQNRIILEIKNDSNYYYMYPEFSDLLDITRKYFTISDIVYNIDNKNKLKQNFIKIAQKVLVAGVAISLVLCVPENVKSYSIEEEQKIYTNITEILPNRVSTPQELNEVFNTQSITKDDVHKAIDENENLIEFKDIIHEYVDDVYKARPEQNWWIFYQNIKRMNIGYNPEVENANGTFNSQTSEIKISETLEGINLEITLRHELTHALSLIDIKIDNTTVKINFYNSFSGYGRSIMEMLTSSFNSYSYRHTDTSYEKYKKLFEPLTKEIGTKVFTNTLFNGDINSFITAYEPYFSNIYEYISYVDAIFFNNYGGDYRTKKNIDKDFLIGFSNMSIEFFVNLQYKQLKEGSISYDYYIGNRTSYINSLYSTINDNLENSDINTITISNLYKYLCELEKQVFDQETLKNIESFHNNKKNLIFCISYSNKTEEFKKIRIDMLEENEICYEYYHDSSNNNINDFYFIIEDVNNNFKLRLINKNNPNYDKIDILTYEYINDYSNIILEVPLIDYINGIPKEIILGKYWSSNDYFTTVNGNFFNIQDIMEFANNQNYNNTIK